MAFLRDVGSYSAVRVAGGGLLFVTQVLLARWMGAESFGIYSYAFAWASVLGTLAGIGLPGTSVRFIAQYLTASDHAKIRGLVRLCKILTALSGTVVVAGGTFVVGVLVGESPYGGPLMLAMLAVPAMALLNLDSSIARGFSWMALSPLALQIGRPAFLLLLGAGLAYLFGETSASSFVLACVAAYVLAWFAQHIVVGRRIEATLGGGSRTYETRIWLRVSVPLLLHSSAQMVLSNLDLVLVAAFLDASELGVYTAAVRIATLVSFAYMVSSMVAQPTISSLHVRQQQEKLQSFVVLASRWAFLASFATGAALICFGPFVLGLFGASFSHGYNALVILVLGHATAAAMGPVVGILIMTGHQDTVALVSGVSIVSAIVLNVVLIPLLGLAGAALANAINLVLSYFALLVMTGRLVKLAPSIFGSLVSFRR
jgi:O-antigen/teichoic acid export membrane protein